MFFIDLPQLEAYLSWLHSKGVREVALKSALTKWWPHITAGLRKRNAVCFQSYSFQVLY